MRELRELPSLLRGLLVRELASPPSVTPVSPNVLRVETGACRLMLASEFAHPSPHSCGGSFHNWAKLATGSARESIAAAMFSLGLGTVSSETDFSSCMIISHIYSNGASLLKQIE
ncbi:Protein of unknown function [Pyronema omphalodes CBS 100304]|uniref:Uncharacterized protein n=1 Tax=Pyronema omphalodes (strain CBS 100304) TaxID=1076935 RepID=U4KZI7_PYROM|nr:Protein of unknown function [Pyronema omphalodes CBS 100304]